MRNFTIMAIILAAISACNSNYNDISAHFPAQITQPRQEYSWVSYLSGEEMFFSEPATKFAQLVHNTSGINVFYVDLKPNQYAGFVYENIPWTSLLSFDFVQSRPRNDMPSNFLMLLSNYSERDKGSYLGVNAFGVTKNVTVTNGKYSGILILPQGDKRSYNELYWSLILNRPNKTIEDYYKNHSNFKWDKNIRIVAKVILPSTAITNGEVTVHKMPTLDDPVRSANNYLFVAVKLDSIMYIDNKTNKVLMKFEK